jgi:peptide/nickel transport system ATP-binding protein
MSGTAPARRCATCAPHFHTRRACCLRWTACRSPWIAARSWAWSANPARASRHRLFHPGPDRPARAHRRGEVLFDGRGPARLARRALRRLRGDRIAMIFQDPMMTLNPVLRIGDEMIEAIQKRTTGAPRRHARARRGAGQGRHPGTPTSALRRLSAPVLRRHAPARGHRHRAAATPRGDHRRRADHRAGRDHPGQILYEMQKLAARERGTALIWITHDLAVVAGLADASA